MLAMPAIAYLECSRCHHKLSADTPQTLCPLDGGVLYVRYDMEALSKTARREHAAELAAASSGSLGMWRYADVLPEVEAVSLGEGWTPMLRSRRYEGLLVKEEGANPTGTFKARGMSMAVSMAKQYGLRHLATPSAGNAAGALAAYAAAAQMKAHIFMPKDVPFANYLEGVVYGADVRMVDGLISDCARMVGEEMKRQKEAGVAAEDAWFDVSTLKEPFRVEGKKTMGYELVEQLGWKYPDAVFYPTGGGVGLIGMWKAFERDGGSWVGLGASGRGCMHCRLRVARRWSGHLRRGSWLASSSRGLLRLRRGCGCRSLMGIRLFWRLCGSRVGRLWRRMMRRYWRRFLIGRKRRGSFFHQRVPRRRRRMTRCWLVERSSVANGWCCSTLVLG